MEKNKRYFKELLKSSRYFSYSFDIKTLCGFENKAKVQKTSSFLVVLCYIYTVTIDFDESDL